MTTDTTTQAIESLIVAQVTNDDMLRRIDHVVRLLELNGHPETAESFSILAEFGRKLRPEPEPEPERDLQPLLGVPEPQERPWDTAETGSVWTLHLEGQDHLILAFMREDGMWKAGTLTIPRGTPQITHGDLMIAGYPVGEEQG